MELYPNPDAFIRLLSPQQGKGLDTDGLQFYKSSYRRQRGRGLGSFFGSLFRKLMPFAKNTVLPFVKTHVLPAAKKGASQLASDILSGRNVKESFKERGQETLKGIGDSLRDQSGSGLRRVRKRKRSCSKSKKSCKRQKGASLLKTRKAKQRLRQFTFSHPQIIGGKNKAKRRKKKTKIPTTKIKTIFD